jgi:hypothetical protein
MNAPPEVRARPRPLAERPRRRRRDRPGAVITGLTLTAVVGVLVAGVGAALWLQRGAPQPAPPVAATPPATPPPPAVTNPSPIPAGPSPVPAGGAVVPAVPGPAATATSRPALPPRAPDQPRVTKQVMFPPRVERQGCPGGDRTIVIVEVESDSEPRSVVLKARGPGNAAPRSTAMSRSGKRWYAPLGPYPTPGMVTWHITVIDAGGRSAMGPAESLKVTDCRR